MDIIVTAVLALVFLTAVDAPLWAGAARHRRRERRAHAGMARSVPHRQPRRAAAALAARMPFKSGRRETNPVAQWWWAD